MYKYFLYGLRVEAIEAETLVVVGSMFITEEHVIQSIYVNPPHRRKGVATAMYRFALSARLTLFWKVAIPET